MISICSMGAIPTDTPESRGRSWGNSIGHGPNARSSGRPAICPVRARERSSTAGNTSSSKASRAPSENGLAPPNLKVDTAFGRGYADAAKAADLPFELPALNLILPRFRIMCSPCVRRSALLAVFIVVTLATSAVLSQAQVGLLQLSDDTFTNRTSQHMTEVEPSAFTWGSTIVTAFQVARISGGGGADIGFATSTDGGAHWTNGYLPGITIFQGNGTYQAASDAAVAYDALHGVWLISTLPIGNSTAVAVSRSTDGINWSNPFFATTAGGPDKNWIVCDNSPASKFYGHCYSEWDSTNSGDLIQMSTSTDGGMTWSTPVATQGNDFGIGGIPLVKPNGKVIVPILGFNGFVQAFSSTNGGQSWTAAVNVGQFINHGEAGDIRSAGLPSAAIDAKGKVYVVWPDCGFRTNCSTNDMVMSKSGNGTTWTVAKRIPIDPVASGVDHFISGMAIEAGTSGTTAHIGLAYYFYPKSNCGNNCQLSVGFIQSSTGGAT